MWSKPTNVQLPASPTASTEDPLSPTTQAKRRNPGRRYAQIVKLKPEHREEYKEVHAKACNIVDYSIFHDEESNILFASFKYVGYDYAGDMEKMRDNPKVREWWKMTDGWQQSLVPGAQSSEAGEPSWWKPVEEVFYYNPS
ncbi:hypothetical protein RB593_007587 [Gaeumannomyces tritici]